MPLTDVAVRNAKSAEKPFKLFDGQGLYLLVQPTGGKLWRQKVSIAGVEKLLSHGAYPEVSLRDARDRRDKAREQLRSGQDPTELKRLAKLARQVAVSNSYEAVARAWHSYWGHDKNEKHRAGVLSRLESDVFPSIGTLPFESVTAQHLVGCALKIEARGAPEYAKRCLQTAAQIGRYAVARGIATRNAAADVKPSDVLRPMRKNEGHARIDPKGLPELLRRIDIYPGSPLTRCAMQLMSFTFVRTSELIGARWCEFDVDRAEWRIPGERMKMKTLHIVPLSRQALAVIDELNQLRNPRSELLFPGERDHERSMSNNTILQALERMGYKGLMTGHGFRSVASTVLHEQGKPHAVIELQLAHQERNKVSAAYNHAQHLEERHELMQEWADYLTDIKRGAEVLPLRRRTQRS